MQKMVSVKRASKRWPASGNREWRPSGHRMDSEAFLNIEGQLCVAISIGLCRSNENIKDSSISRIRTGR